MFVEGDLQQYFFDEDFKMCGIYSLYTGEIFQYTENTTRYIKCHNTIYWLEIVFQVSNQLYFYA